jgi:hypothetical protein
MDVKAADMFSLSPNGLRYWLVGGALTHSTGQKKLWA